METKFSQVAHLYLGCEIQDEEKPQGTTAILDSIDTNGDCYYNYYDNETYQSDTDSIMCNVSDIKPILKSLEDITPDVILEWANIARQLGQDVDTDSELELAEAACKTIKKKGINALCVDEGDFHLVPYVVNLFLSKGYDLFNLIETGQAINAKTV